MHNIAGPTGCPKINYTFCFLKNFWTNWAKITRFWRLCKCVFWKFFWYDCHLQALDSLAVRAISPKVVRVEIGKKLIIVNSRPTHHLPRLLRPPVSLKHARRAACGQSETKCSSQHDVSLKQSKRLAWNLLTEIMFQTGRRSQEAGSKYCHDCDQDIRAFFSDFYSNYFWGNGSHG